jgi:hypothetical protein
MRQKLDHDTPASRGRIQGPHPGAASREGVTAFLEKRKSNVWRHRK